MTKQQFENHLEKLTDADLLKVAKVVEGKMRRAVARGEEKINPKLLREMRAEIEYRERGQ